MNVGMVLVRLKIIHETKERSQTIVSGKYYKKKYRFDHR